MRISPRGFSALRVWVIVAVVMGWNVGLGIAFVINGGGRRIVDPTARWIAGGTMSAASLLAASILLLPSVRTALTAPSRRDRYDPAPYWLVALICGVMAALMLLDL